MKWKFILLGFAFAFLWASASTATKIALQSAQPFVIAVSRFFMAGIIMLLTAHGIMGKRLPQKKEWKHIIIYGLLNVSIYLGLYVLAMEKVSAGLGTLAVGMNPVIINIMAAIVFRQRIAAAGIVSLLLCCLGVFIAAWPLLQTSYASIDGMVLMLTSMIAYSAGAIYYSRTHWNGLDIITINGWQTLLGGVFLLPVLFFTFKTDRNVFDFKFWGGTLWLVIPVSIGAVQCWLLLLKNNAAKAAYWLFLCPIFGFIIAWAFLKEPLSFYTLLGILLVICGLYIVQKYKIADGYSDETS
ncbi:MAG: EamA family transporter [Ferruginibacter sp.]